MINEGNLARIHSHHVRDRWRCVCVCVFILYDVCSSLHFRLLSIRRSQIISSSTIFPHLFFLFVSGCVATIFTHCMEKYTVWNWWIQLKHRHDYHRMEYIRLKTIQARGKKIENDRGFHFSTPVLIWKK